MFLDRPPFVRGVHRRAARRDGPAAEAGGGGGAGVPGIPPQARPGDGGRQPGQSQLGSESKKGDKIHKRF